MQVRVMMVTGVCHNKQPGDLEAGVTPTEEVASNVEQREESKEMAFWMGKPMIVRTGLSSLSEINCCIIRLFSDWDNLIVMTVFGTWEI